MAQSGGISGSGSGGSGTSGGGVSGTYCTSGGNNFTINSEGKACSPSTAPQRVKDAVQAANVIRNKPYRYGGGHGSFYDSGYDCSGAVSYALHAEGETPWLSYPLDSSGFMHWGEGNAYADHEWIKVYSNPGHVWMKVKNPWGSDNGIRWDTSDVGGDSVEGNGPSSGPDWHYNPRSAGSGDAIRHPKNYS
jgi:hypothetical protein